MKTPEFYLYNSNVLRFDDWILVKSKQNISITSITFILSYMGAHKFMVKINY